MKTQKDEMGVLIVYSVPLEMVEEHGVLLGCVDKPSHPLRILTPLTPPILPHNLQHLQHNIPFSLILCIYLLYTKMVAI